MVNFDCPLDRLKSPKKGALNTLLRESLIEVSKAGMLPGKLGITFGVLKLIDKIKKWTRKESGRWFY